MRLADLLDSRDVRVLPQVASKRRLMAELAEIAALRFGLKTQDVLEALLLREANAPTGVGHGVALPHARLEGLDRVHGLFLRLDRPVEFESVDRAPVDLVFCLLAPAQAGVEHLRALAVVARTLRDKATCQKLRANADPAKLHMILTEGITPLAA